MRMYKSGRYAMCAAVISAVLLSFTGCGEKGGELDPDNPVSISVMTYYNGSSQLAFEQLVSEFNETEGKEKGIFVESNSSGDLEGLNKTIQMELEKGESERELPNIIQGYASEMQELVRKQAVVSLEDYFTEEELEQYVPSYIEEGRIGADGELMLLPIAKSTEIMTVNETDWEKFAEASGAQYGDLETWEGLAETAEKYYRWSDSLTAGKNDGKAFFSRDAVANYILCGLRQLDADLFQPDGDGYRAVVDRTAMKKIWDCYYVPYISGCYGTFGKYSSDGMKTGEILAMVGSSSGAAFAPGEVTVGEDEPYKITTTVLPVPNFVGKSPMAVQQGAGMAVSSSTPLEEEASAAFLKWFTKKDVNTHFAVESAYLPVREDANDLDYISASVKKQDITWNSTLEQAMSVSLDTVKNSELYTMPLFEGNSQCRKAVSKELEDKAAADYEAVQQELEKGSDRTDVLAQFDTQEAFEEWCEELEKTLADILQQ